MKTAQDVAKLRVDDVCAISTIYSAVESALGSYWAYLKADVAAANRAASTKRVLVKEAAFGS